MHKPFVSLLFVFILISCGKTDPNNPVTPSTPSTPTNTYWAHNIPNWWSNDTLYGYIMDINDQWTGKYDTMYTKTVNDTSYIVYKNTQYYIWTTAFSNLDTFKTDRSAYGWCVINDRRDTINAKTRRTNQDIACPHKYKDNAGNWEYNIQRITIYDYKYTIFKCSQYISRVKRK